MHATDEISQALFDAFKGIVPPPDQRGKPSQYAADSLTGLLGRFYEKARELRRIYRPGIFSRARIVLALQRKLFAAGYPDDMVRQVLFSLILSAFVGKV